MDELALSFVGPRQCGVGCKHGGMVDSAKVYWRHLEQ